MILGAMTMPNEHVKIEKMIQDAVEKGAKIECGGSKVQSLKGQFFQPTVISNVTHDMVINNTSLIKLSNHRIGSIIDQIGSIIDQIGSIIDRFGSN